jgi:FkbH-like protein
VLCATLFLERISPEDDVNQAMKLIEAFEILRKPAPVGAQRLTVGLVCGFTPLHFKTLLTARLRLLAPDRQIEIETGLYGDFLGNLNRLESLDCDAGVIVLEWTDLDPRLGFRSLGSWAPSSFPDILENIKVNCSQIERGIQTLSKDLPLIFSAPTLSFPPIATTSSRECGAIELQIKSLVASLAASVAQTTHVRVVNPWQLDLRSAPGERFDVDSELVSGFPYKLMHAAVLAEMLGHLLQNPAPKKGIITDLDDTLWKGILGEVGVGEISWDLNHHSSMHGAYQRLLHALSGCGVLVGVASKNDPSVVDEAFRRKDLILPASATFPIEAHWGPKSESVGRILKAWNIGADSVVFVDDSAMELAEVKGRYPEIECIQFPAESNPSILDLLIRLRDLFGKTAIFEEDKLRLDSLRRGQAVGGIGGDPAGWSEEFVRQVESDLTFSYEMRPPDPRALELINKTNQFNLNGKKYTEASWRSYLKTPHAFLLVASYRDKFGSLGKIAALAGRREGRELFIEVWVMSCRAFSRRIEHKCLEELFARFDVDEILLDFAPSPRNGPFRSFLEEVCGPEVAPAWRLSRNRLFSKHINTLHGLQGAVDG